MFFLSDEFAYLHNKFNTFYPILSLYNEFLGLGRYGTKNEQYYRSHFETDFNFLELNKNLIQDNCSPKVFEGKIDYQSIDLNYFTTVSDLELALKTILTYYKNRFIKVFGIYPLAAKNKKAINKLRELLLKFTTNYCNQQQA